MTKLVGLGLLALPFAALAAAIWVSEGPLAVAIIFGATAAVALTLVGGAVLLLS